MKQQAIAIIPARGGSKRIPKKNIREFCGRPILAYSIEAAKAAGCFDEVMVSTDSDEIAQIAREYGASVPFFRSEEASGDHATTAAVIEEVLSRYEERGCVYECFCCLYSTAPFVTAEKLREAMRRFAASGCDALLPVVAFGFPPQRAFWIRDGVVCYRYPGHEKTRSQDLEKLYHDCGQFYLGRPELLRRLHTLVPPRTLPFPVSEEEVQDIDTETDWRLAEMKYRLMQEGY